jgi:chemotaxis protein MotB
MANDERPIIIKKVKKVAGGHHGGAWKVAYADFVTAMMAFFLLLLLLYSVEEGKLESLAEYFTPTIGLKDSMGIGFEGGQTANIDGTKKVDRSDPGIIVGVDITGATQNQIEEKAVIEGEKDAQLFEKAEESIKRAFSDDPNLRDLSDNIIVEQSPEGLKIEITDSDKYPMFQPGSANLSRFGQTILAKMSKIIELMPNFISITGHTDVSPMSTRGNAYGNWELSIDRANAARRYLLRIGMEPERPKAVTGKADTTLLLPRQPLSPRNRRITVILLRGDYMDLGAGALPASRELLSVPKPGKKTDQKLEELQKDMERLNKKKPEVEATPLLPGQTAGSSGGSDPLDALSAPASADAAGEEAPAEPEPPKTTEEQVKEFEEFLE